MFMMKIPDKQRAFRANFVVPRNTYLQPDMPSLSGTSIEVRYSRYS